MAKRRESILWAICLGGAFIGLLVTQIVLAIVGLELRSNIGLDLEPDNQLLYLISGAFIGGVIGGWIYRELTEDDL